MVGSLRNYFNEFFVIGTVFVVVILTGHVHSGVFLAMEELMQQCPLCPGIMLSNDINYCHVRKLPVCCCMQKTFQMPTEIEMTILATVTDKDGLKRLKHHFHSHENPDGTVVANVTERKLKKYVDLCREYGSPTVTIELNLTRVMTGRFDWIDRKEFKHILTWNVTNGLPIVPETRYLTYEEIFSWMYLLERLELVKLYNMGRSSEQQPIVGIKLMPANPGKTEGAIFIEAGLHSREWLAPAALIYAVNKILHEKENPLFRRYEIHVSPMVNPDGYAKTFLGYQNEEKCGPLPFNRFWRKNTRKVSGHCSGVDLNRNFDAKFKEGFNDSTPCNDVVFGGSSPFSEPESRAIRNHIVTLLRHKRIRAYVSLHAYGQFVLYPYSFTTNEKEVPKNIHDLKRVANEVANAMSTAGNTTYMAGTVPELITENEPVHGGSIDWAHLIGVPYSFAIELRPTNDTNRFCGGFNPKPSSIPLAGEDLYFGILTMLTSI